MVWARAALVGGLVLMCAAFALGVEHQQSAMVAGQPRDCGPSISASWLVSGTPDRTSPESAGTPDERRAAAACRPVIGRSRVLVLTAIGVGALVSLIGWSGLRRAALPPDPTYPVTPVGLRR